MSRTVLPAWSGRLDLRRWKVFAVARSRLGWGRVRGSFVPILQSAVGAAFAWAIATGLFHRDAPIFAPIATWVCLGFKIDRVPRKVAELGAGATLGVAIGELFAHWFSIGPVQIGVLLLVSALAGRFLDRGDLFTVQAGVNSIVVLGMSWWLAAAGGVQGRWLDALVGAAVAFVVAVLLPRHPTSRPRRYAANALGELATMLDMLARGLQAGDLELLADVKGQRRALVAVVQGWEETLSTAREVVALNPALWRHREEVGELDRLFRLARRAQRSVDMLTRQGTGMIEEVGTLPVVGDLVADAARATRALAGSVRGWNRPVLARELLVGVAARLGPADIGSDDWRPMAITAILRSLAVDLLQLTGLSNADARATLPDTWGRPYAEEPEPDDALNSDDDASPLWG